MNTTTVRADTAGSDRPAHSVRRRRVGVILATAALAVFGVVGCSKEQRQDLGEEDVRVALSSHVEQAVSGQDLEIDGDLDCTSDITPDSSLTASCSGTTTSGEAITGTFTGTADVDAETCTADLAVEVAGRSIADEPDVECFEDI